MHCFELHRVYLIQFTYNSRGLLVLLLISDLFFTKGSFISAAEQLDRYLMLFYQYINRERIGFLKCRQMHTLPRVLNLADFFNVDN